MKEEFLHYLWKYSLYDHNSLIDCTGNRVVVLNPGEYNRDAGPDFFNARILIDGTEWAGNVEIHLKASHFYSHSHEKDPAYDNVILHIVAENDKIVFNSKGEQLLTIAIMFDEGLYEKYLELINNPLIIACQTEIPKLDPFYIRHWLYSLVIKRLQDKTDYITRIFSETGNDWDETFYRLISRYFGFRVNTEPFEMLAAALPYKIIRKHSDNRHQIESLLFGMSGMLDEGLFREALSDDYYRNLIKEFRFLSSKYSLRPIHGWLWKFSRLRPVNFPSIRISQLAGLLTLSGGIFSRILEVKDLDQLNKMFESQASSFWDNHYMFGKESINKPKNTGLQATEIFIINSVVPVLFSYGMMHKRSEICERAITFLEGINPEINSVIKDWNDAGIEAESAFYTQGLLQLTEEYCRKRKCLECRLGCKIIGLGKSLVGSDKLILEP